MRIQTVVKRVGLCSILALLVLTSNAGLTQNTPSKISLVGNIVPTLIDHSSNPSRASDIVKKALNRYPVSITATTQAWSGSGLRNGNFVGFIDHYSLNVERNTYLYSAPYLVLPLHIASRSVKAVEADRLDKIYRTSLGIENRFANTDELRAERSVRWARTPDFLANVKQLADRRVDNIIADKFMLDEFNKMLMGINKPGLFLSSKPIYEVEMRLAIKADAPSAKAIINEFNASLEMLKESGEYEGLIQASSDSVSLLDEALYSEILRKW